MKFFLFRCLFLFFLCFSTAEAQGTKITTLNIGIGHFYPPFVYNYATGFDVALMSHICTLLHERCVFHNMSLTEIMTQVAAGQLDAGISAISITPNRFKQLDFTRPYLMSTVSFIGLKSRKYGGSAQEQTVGVIAYSTFNTYLSAATQLKAKVKTYKNYGDLLDALSGGDIDLILLDTPAAQYWVNQPGSALKFVGQPFPILFDQGFGIAVRKGNAPLANQFNRALLLLKSDGTYDRLVNMYFSPRADGSSSVLMPAWLAH